MQKFFMLIMLVGAMTGCASVGNEKMANQTQNSISQQLQEGKTTKEEVLASLGNADSVSFTDSGNEIWTYKYSRMKPHMRNFVPFLNWFSSGADVSTKEVVVMFKDNVVSKYTMRKSDSVRKAGIAE